MSSSVFTRIDKDTLLYQFTVEDPTIWTEPWSGEYVWPASGQRVYEYACHEANYSFAGILRGARTLEAEAAESDGSVSPRLGLHVRYDGTIEVHSMRISSNPRLTLATALAVLAGLGWLLTSVAPVQAHHAFGAEFDPKKTLVAKRAGRAGGMGKSPHVDPHGGHH